MIPKGFFTPNRRAFALALLLLALVLAVYAQSARFGFITVDDPDYVVKNPMLINGFSKSALSEAFGVRYQNFWIPLTWLSFIAEAKLGGFNPAVYHGTNIALFSMCAVALLSFFYIATGSAWGSFFAAALWALHPLRVESAVWVSERKDLLAGFFFILALIAYLRRERGGSRAWLVALYAFFILALMSKPVAAVLPLALLLLDFWPLGRINRESAGRLILGKLPLFGLSALIGAVTVYAQFAVNPIKPLKSSGDLAAVGLNYWQHAARTFWPAGVVFKSSWGGQGAALGYFAFALLCLGVWAAVRHRERFPEMAFGFLWFAALLFPNCGLVAAGLQGYADRFAFLPHIGVAAALVFGIPKLLDRGGKRKIALALLCSGLLVALGAASFTRAALWRDTKTLFSAALQDSGADDPLILGALAVDAFNKGKMEEALDYYRRVERIAPDYPLLHNNKAAALVLSGRNAEALSELAIILSKNPADENALLMRSAILQRMGRRN